MKDYYHSNEYQRILKLRNYSDEALEKRRQEALRRVRDIERVQKERNGEKVS